METQEVAVTSVRGADITQSVLVAASTVAVVAIAAATISFTCCRAAAGEKRPPRM